jgi:hypothetical protein
VQRALDGRGVSRIVIRPPKLVNVVPAEPSDMSGDRDDYGGGRL